LLLLSDSDKALMRGVGGMYKQPGEFRRSQNWIGAASINDAIFIPPHQDDLLAFMMEYLIFK